MSSDQYMKNKVGKGLRRFRVGAVLSKVAGKSPVGTAEVCVFKFNPFV